MPYPQLIGSKMPDNIGRSRNGYSCLNCHAIRMNSKTALAHNCKKSKKRIAKLLNGGPDPSKMEPMKGAAGWKPRTRRKFHNY